MSNLWEPAAETSGSQRVARGIVRAVRAAALKADIAARIERIGFREGERFAKGDVLIAFDCRRPRAELRAAEAQHREMALTLKSNVYLKRRRAIGRHDVEIAKARVAKAKADADVIRATTERCELKAPFAGTVGALGVRPFESPGVGDMIMEIVSNTALEIELIVPSRWLRWVRRDLAFDMFVDELDSRVEARITRVGKVVDAVSQTVKLYAQPTSATRDLRAGMSGKARFLAGR
ncbi:MAG: efflux RND transporter periplasmic adaptor subunit [Pseudomonadota bacterium]